MTVLVANVTGFATTLIVGSIWLKFATGMPLNQALIAGCVNFLLPDMIKAICSAGIGFLDYVFCGCVSFHCFIQSQI